MFISIFFSSCNWIDELITYNDRMTKIANRQRTFALAPAHLPMIASCTHPTLRLPLARPWLKLLLVKSTRTMTAMVPVVVLSTNTVDASPLTRPVLRLLSTKLACICMASPPEMFLHLFPPRTAVTTTTITAFCSENTKKASIGQALATIPTPSGHMCEKKHPPFVSFAVSGFNSFVVIQP